MDCNKIGSFLICLLALCFMILAIILPDISDRFLRKRIKEARPFTNGSASLEKWMNPTVPVYIKFYIFNITNKEDFMAGDIPKFVECGPYVYRQKDNITILKWDFNETVLSYSKNKSYIFEPDLSNGTEDDIITMINVPLAVTVNFVQSSSNLKNAVLKLMKKSRDETFLNNTVRDFFFNGFRSDLVSNIASWGGRERPDLFYLFRNRNGSFVGGYSIDTGKPNIEKFGSLYLYNAFRRMQCWNDSRCGKVKGTDGTLFHPFINKTERLDIFASDIFRSIFFKFERESSVKDISTLKFEVPREALLSPTASEENSCYCVDNDTLITEKGFCSLDGVIDLSKCAPKGAPIIVSLPHFFNADPILLNATIGLNPEKEKHSTYIEIEPITGFVLKARKRLQMNVYLKNVLQLGGSSYIRDMVYPLYWVEESGEVDEANAKKMKELIFDKIHLALMISIASFSISALLIFISIVIILWPIVKKKLEKKDKLAQTKDVNKNFASYSYSGLNKTNNQLEN